MGRRIERREYSSDGVAVDDVDLVALEVEVDALTRDAETVDVVAAVDRRALVVDSRGITRPSSTTRSIDDVDVDVLDDLDLDDAVLEVEVAVRVTRVPRADDARGYYGDDVDETVVRYNFSTAPSSALEDALVAVDEGVERRRVLQRRLVRRRAAVETVERSARVIRRRFDLDAGASPSTASAGVSSVVDLAPLEGVLDDVEGCLDAVDAVVDQYRGAVDDASWRLASADEVLVDAIATLDAVLLEVAPYSSTSVSSTLEDGRDARPRSTRERSVPR